MARICGYVVHHEAEGDNPEYYDGALDLTYCNGKIYLLPNPKKRKETSRDFTIFLRVGDQQIEYGGAWRKPFKTSGTFLSMQVDHEDMPAPVDIAAFPRDEQPTEGKITHYNVQWERKKKAKPAPAVKENAEAEGPFS